MSFPFIPPEISLGSFEPYREEMQEMHAEVMYCLWAMNVSLAVYMNMLRLVDIGVRQEVSDVVGRFLADWKDGRSHSLSDALDVLIISEFTKRAISPVPDMAHLQRERHCESISSTVASYIRDIAVNLDNMRSNDLESTVEFLFPHTKKFIGRCFFPRLAMVSCRLLDILRDCHATHPDETLLSESSTKSCGTSELSDLMLCDLQKS